MCCAFRFEALFSGPKLALRNFRRPPRQYNTVAIRTFALNKNWQNVLFHSFDSNVRFCKMQDPQWLLHMQTQTKNPFSTPKKFREWNYFRMTAILYDFPSWITLFNIFIFRFCTCFMCSEIYKDRLLWKQQGNIYSACEWQGWLKWTFYRLGKL